MTSSLSAAASSDPTMRLPLLAAAGSAGLAYATWRPQMRAHMMRNGIEERDYTEAISQWERLNAAVQADARTEEQAAFAALLGGRAPSPPRKTAGGGASSSKLPADDDEPFVKKEALTPAQEAAKTRATTALARVRKAFGYLWAALPADLRLLVADVPQGYAFGLWHFLEKKFRSTEQDSVASLWSQLVCLSQDSSEMFDAYKARVDSVQELLGHAKETVPAGLYSTLVLGRLQPGYSTAVLTLKTSDKLKDPASIDWSGIANYMAEYERTQQSLGDADGNADRAMAARAQKGTRTSSVKGGGRPLSEIKCFNCDKMGHYASNCPQPSKKDKNKSAHKDARTWSGGSDDETVRESAAHKPDASERAHMARSANRYQALSDDEDKGQMDRSYCAVVMGLATADSSSSPKPLTRLKRPGDKKDAAPAENKAAAAKSAETKAAAAAKPAERERERELGVRPVQPAPAPRPAAPPAKSLDLALKTTAKAVDSAATVSTTGNRETLINVRRCIPMLIKVADGTVLSAMYKGDLPLRLPLARGPDSYVKVTINDVYYHERFDANLLSWGCMRNDGWQMHSDQNGTYLVTPGGKRVNASTRGKMTLLEDSSSERVYGVSSANNVVCMTAHELVQLHRRLAHASWTRLVEMCKTGATVGIGDIRAMPAAELAKAEKAVKECEHCIAAKAHRKALGRHGLDKGTRAGEVLHADTFYAVVRNSTTGKKYTEYYLSAVDAFTEWRWTDTRTSIADLPRAMEDMLEHSHTLNGRYPRLLIADLGSEFENKKLKDCCRKHGIVLQPSPARAKELNGLAEKNVDTTKNHVRAMLDAAGMPADFALSRAVQHHTFVWNRTHVGQHTGVTPYQAMTGREASVLNLGEFGCDAYVHQHRSMRDATFDRKAEPAIYLGHDGRRNCPVVLLVRSGQTIMSKDVQFREGSFKHLRALLTGHAEDIESVAVSCLPADDAGVPPAQESDVEDDDKSVQDDAPAEKQWRLRGIIGSDHIDGELFYCCKWVGFRAPTWEPAKRVAADAKDAVDAYEQTVQDRAEAAASRSMQTRSSARMATVSASSPAPSADKDGDAKDSEESEVGMAAAFAARCL
jgi:transposase InsO family protein